MLISNRLNVFECTCSYCVTRELSPVENFLWATDRSKIVSFSVGFPTNPPLSLAALNSARGQARNSFRAEVVAGGTRSMVERSLAFRKIQMSTQEKCESQRSARRQLGTFPERGLSMFESQRFSSTVELARFLMVKPSRKKAAKKVARTFETHRNM